VAHKNLDSFDRTFSLGRPAPKRSPASFDTIDGGAAAE
jgi:hypothetical protein